MWMRAVIACAQHDAPLWRAVLMVSDQFGDDLIDRVCALRVGGPWNLKGSSRGWLAQYFRPVSDGLFDGKVVDDLIHLWKRTKRGEHDPQSAWRAVGMRKRRQNIARGNAMGQAVWAHGWRANHAWNVVK